MKSRLTAAVLTGVVAAGLLSSSALAENITIKAATGGSPKPYVYVDENNEAAGYDIDVLKEVFNRLDGYDLEIEVTEFPSMFSGLNSGIYQLAVNNLSYNDERAQSYLYSYPYDKVSYVFITKTDADPITTFADAAGKTFEGQAGVNVTTAVETWNEKNPDQLIDIAYTDAETPITLQHIADGAVDFGIIDLAMYVAYTAEYEYDVVATPIEDEDEEIIAKNLYAYYLLPLDDAGEELREKINPIIKELKEDGTLAELAEQYFGQDTSPEAEQYEETVN